ATAGGLSGATGAACAITPGSATQRVFTLQPTTATAGGTIKPAVRVTARDALGNTATGFVGNVTVAIGTNPAGGTLGGTRTFAAIAGVATFPSLSINQAGKGRGRSQRSPALRPSPRSVSTRRGAATRCPRRRSASRG